jgi:hypothetical protein
VGEGARQAEVGQFEPPVVRVEDVAELDVSVHYPVTVQVLQRLQ